MALPVGVARLGAFKGKDGDKGDTGTLAYAEAQTVPADQPATVEMIGPQSNRGAKFFIPRGLPGASDVPTDPAMAVILGATDSESRAVLESAIVKIAPARGGSSKTDGQNVRNLRRPTLVADRTYPTNRADHQIVYVDEVAKVAYSVGRDQRFRRSTWVSNSGIAENWVVPLSSAVAPDKCAWCSLGVFLKDPITGHLFMDQVNYQTGAFDLIRSMDGGVSWASVLTLPGPNVKRFLGPQSLARDEATGYLYVVEYVTQPAATTADIWRSTDGGSTWTVWKTMPRSDEDSAGTIRHWHSARWDSVSERVYFTAGDGNSEGGIYRVNGTGADIEPVVLNRNLPYGVAFPGIGYPARAVDIMFFPTHIAWANDGGGGASAQNYVYRMHRDQIGQTSPDVEQVAAIDNTGWWAIKAATDGSTWVISTSSEINGGPNPDAYTTHLYAVTANGSQVDELSAVQMDGNEIGIGSISGIGVGGSMSPEFSQVSFPKTKDVAFWLRAHNYSDLPSSQLVFSGFQIRARIAQGVTPLTKPSAPSRVYQRASRNWYGSLAAGAMAEFAHATVPQRTTRLILFNYGVRTRTAPSNSFVLEVYNESKTQIILTVPASTRDHRWVLDADEWSTFVNCSPGDQIIFRVKEIAGATPSGLAFVDYGFALPA